MGRRIVIHGGFHKTGTTTVQRTLHANGPVLWPVMALGLRWRLKPVLAAARAYSVWGDPVSLTLFAERFDAYLGSIELGKFRGLCVSSEELVGHMPGRDEITDYGAAPVLLSALIPVIRRRFPKAFRRSM